MAAERDPQVDLTVVQEDASGRCTVVWKDPWSGSKRRGPFQCDPDRDPILWDFESGFVVSYGPWKGDLYNADLEGTPAYAVNGGLSFFGFLVLVGSGIGGGVRHVHRAVQRRAARRPRMTGGPWSAIGLGVGTSEPPSAGTEKSEDLSYAAWTELARRTSMPPSVSPHRREADVRAVPWWRVRALRELSQLEGMTLGAVCLLVALLQWLFGGGASVPVIAMGAMGGVMVIGFARRAVSHGLADVRRLVRAARAPVSVPRPYVLVHDPCDGTPVLILFPAHAGPDTQPDAVLAVRAPGTDRRPRQGLPEPVGTADLRGWLDEEPTVVPWIEDRAFWPLHGLREVRAGVTEDRNYLRHLMGETEKAFTCHRVSTL
ncbi:hypothetical protein [Streptomyces kebangsaanensis]|uniref:hypothetical protein n=1 Tax=Streptomyces kebangsaanensis TaxID=864058 RepID=UPI001160FE0F|nr:hypothetical protein [Streptomyces kebangsaanensis]